MLGLVMYATVLLWLLPGAIWRPVAMALLVTWTLSEVAFQIGGDFEPLWIYIPGDALVIATVIWKRSHWSDWIVLAPYPAVWFLYTMPVTQEQWLCFTG